MLFAVFIISSRNVLRLFQLKAAETELDECANGSSAGMLNITMKISIQRRVFVRCLGSLFLVGIF